MWSHLSPIVTLSHWVTLVTHCHIVTCGHIRSLLSKEINISTADQKVHSLEFRTRPTYRPAWPQVKTKWEEITLVICHRRKNCAIAMKPLWGSLSLSFKHRCWPNVYKVGQYLGVLLNSCNLFFSIPKHNHRGTQCRKANYAT